MAPIRVGIVGLSSKPGAWATLAHFPRLHVSHQYQIVALCNSSIESAKAAVQHLALASDTKTYSSYSDLANDPDVDLVVVSTRADSHIDIALPALEAGKDVFVEWPLAATTSDARRMAEVARRKGVKTLIGFQARASPTILKIKHLVDSGELGEIYSVNYHGALDNWKDGMADERYSHFLDRKAGANMLTIYGGHLLDALLYCFGELKRGSYRARAFNQRQNMPVKSVDGTAHETRPKDTPDQVMLQGVIDRHPPAVISMHLRTGPRFLEEPGSCWRIYGSRGELVVWFRSAGPQMAKATSMKLSRFDTGTVDTIVPDEGGKEWTDLPPSGQNLGRLYEAYAVGGPYADFDVALKRHELLDEFWESMKEEEEEEEEEEEA